MNVTIPEFEKEIETALELMSQAGEIFLDNYNNPQGIKLKPDRSLVTGIDVEVSKLIFSELGRKFPSYGILDEEHGGKKLGRRRIFLVDPLDNTRGYVEKTGDFGIMIGLLDSREPVLGITYNPQKNEFAYAARGSGAFLLQGEKITKLKASDSNAVHVLVSSFRSSEELEAMLKKIKPDSIKYMGGSLKTVEVAKGNATLFLCPKSSSMSSWDICAPSVILEEANGRMTDLYGNRFTFQNLEDNKNYNGVVATNRRIHNMVLERISH
jgi:fructose-1,6-bisphosphatase/inositol monophosphatase family enzyme